MRNSANEYLLIEDFSQKKSPAIIMHSEALSNALPFWNLTDPEDAQLAGDFLALGHSQALFINRNHTKDEKEKVILLDFSSDISSPSIKYQENWKDGSLPPSWFDTNDTQLVGDFMGRGHSQMLFVNHGKNRGKIAIIDFSKSGGKPPASILVADKWNGSGLFEGWLGLNDTKIAGDFKGFGYSQVLFLNSSSTGTNATIVEFASGKPLIAI